VTETSVASWYKKMETITQGKHAMSTRVRIIKVVLAALATILALIARDSSESGR
jgi:hypothetical protein